VEAIAGDDGHVSSVHVKYKNPVEKVLHLAGGRLKEICIRLAASQMIYTEQLMANRMQILQKYTC
jgi:hypothetical protein